MADFCVLQDIEDLLQVEITTAAQVTSAQRAIIEATAAIRNYCKQVIELVSDETITLDGQGGTRLHLPQLPVVEVISVYEDGVLLAPGTDYKLGQHGILHRLRGAVWSVGIQNIEISYSHGYDVYDQLPQTIRDICTRAASRAYQAGLKSAEMAGVPGVASYGLGDYNISFTSEHGGGAGEGVMGASGARMLLLSEKDMLNTYRIKE